MKNTKYLGCKANNKNLKSYEVLYFNDKYIFVQVTDSALHKLIEVFKFEDFASNDNCSEW